MILSDSEISANSNCFIHVGMCVVLRLFFFLENMPTEKEVTNNGLLLSFYMEKWDRSTDFCALMASNLILTTAVLL